MCGGIFLVLFRLVDELGPFVEPFFVEFLEGFDGVGGFSEDLSF